MKSCLMLSVEAVGQEITTIEGLNDTPTQQAFLERWAFSADLYPWIYHELPCASDEQARSG